jgi:hypothetical protein
MSSSTTETPVVRAETVNITGDTVTAELSDGHSIWLIGGAWESTGPH